MRKSTVFLLVLALVFASATTVGFADYEVVFNENFDNVAQNSDLEPEWTLQGREDTSPYGYDQDGSGYSSDQMWVGGDLLPLDYMRLTNEDTSNWQRASAFYTNNTFESNGWWQMTARVNIGGPDTVTDTDAGRETAGLGLVWVDSDTVNLDDGTGELLGGWGEYVGAPRGAEVNAGDVGYYSNTDGYGVVLDEEWINNAVADGSRQQDLSDWSTVSGSEQDLSSDTNFFYNDGWVDIKLTKDGSDEFTLAWGQNYANSYTWTDDNYRRFDQGYFGFTAGTDSFSATHALDDVKLATPEPGTLFLVLPGAALLYWRRRRDEE